MVWSETSKGGGRALPTIGSAWQRALGSGIAKRGNVLATRSIAGNATVSTPRRDPERVIWTSTQPHR